MKATFRDSKRHARKQCAWLKTWRGLARADGNRPEHGGMERAVNLVRAGRAKCEAVGVARHQNVGAPGHVRAGHVVGRGAEVGPDDGGASWYGKHRWLKFEIDDVVW